MNEEKLRELRLRTGRQWAWYFYQELGYRITEDFEQEESLKKAIAKILDGTC
jgi:hypothetical protein